VRAAGPVTVLALGSGALGKLEAGAASAAAAYRRGRLHGPGRPRSRDMLLAPADLARRAGFAASG
jgi:hypothetical protein